LIYTLSLRQIANFGLFYFAQSGKASVKIGLEFCKLDLCKTADLNIEGNEGQTCKIFL